MRRLLRALVWLLAALCALAWLYRKASGAGLAPTTAVVFDRARADLFDEPAEPPPTLHLTAALPGEISGVIVRIEYVATSAEARCRFNSFARGGSFPIERNHYDTLRAVGSPVLAGGRRLVEAEVPLGPRELVYCDFEVQALYLKMEPVNAPGRGTAGSTIVDLLPVAPGGSRAALRPSLVPPGEDEMTLPVVDTLQIDCRPNPVEARYNPLNLPESRFCQAPIFFAGADALVPRDTSLDRTQARLHLDVRYFADTPLD